MNSLHSLSEGARLFAVESHGNQVRKYTGEPYWHHPEEVVDILYSAIGTPDETLIAAAWLHDVVEDTPITAGQIEKRFGWGVAALVIELTNQSKLEDGNRAVRKAIDRISLNRASNRAKTIKLADVIDNTSNIVDHGPKAFAAIYLDEIGELLPCLIGGHPDLMNMATIVHRVACRKLSRRE